MQSQRALHSELPPRHQCIPRCLQSISANAVPNEGEAAKMDRDGGGERLGKGGILK